MKLFKCCKKKHDIVLLCPCKAMLTLFSGCDKMSKRETQDWQEIMEAATGEFYFVGGLDAVHRP